MKEKPEVYHKEKPEVYHCKQSLVVKSYKEDRRLDMVAVHRLNSLVPWRLKLTIEGRTEELHLQ